MFIILNQGLLILLGSPTAFNPLNQVELQNG
jgi:hypothetical protein